MDLLPIETQMNISTTSSTRIPSETLTQPTITIIPSITSTDWVPDPNMISLSPDGTWKAKVFDLYPLSYMDVIHSDETTVWTLVHNGEETGWYEARLRPVHWSIDGKSLYYTVQPFIDGFILFNVYSGLGRLNLVTGETEVIFDTGRDLYTLSVSPDSSLLGYIKFSDKPLRLAVREMLSGDEED
jgi:hypothetical protein